MSSSPIENKALQFKHVAGGLVELTAAGGDTNVENQPTLHKVRLWELVNGPFRIGYRSPEYVTGELPSHAGPLVAHIYTDDKTQERRVRWEIFEHPEWFVDRVLPLALLTFARDSWQVKARAAFKLESEQIES